MDNLRWKSKNEYHGVEAFHTARKWKSSLPMKLQSTPSASAFHHPCSTYIAFMANKQYIISYNNTWTTKIKCNHTSSILAFPYTGIYIIHIHSDRVYLNPNSTQYMKRKNKSREEIIKKENAKTNQVNEESIR